MDPRKTQIDELGVPIPDPGVQIPIFEVRDPRFGSSGIGLVMVTRSGLNWVSGWVFESLSFWIWV